MKLTLDKLVDLHRGIGALDVGHEITVDGKSARRPFKFGALVHYPLQQNAAAIEPHFQTWKKANEMLFNEQAESFTDEKGAPQQRIPADKLAAFKAQAQTLLDQVVQVKLYRVKLSDLKRGTDEGQNPINLAVLTLLAPILHDDMPKDQLEEAKDEEPAAGEAKA